MAIGNAYHIVLLGDLNELICKVSQTVSDSEWTLNLSFNLKMNREIWMTSSHIAWLQWKITILSNSIEKYINIKIWSHRSISSPQGYIVYVVLNWAVNLGKKKQMRHFSWYLGIFLCVPFISNFKTSLPIPLTDRLWKNYNLVWEGSELTKCHKARQIVLGKTHKRKPTKIDY